MLNIAFAGLRHDHIYDLFNMAKENKIYTILGGFEENDEARKVAEEKGISCHYETFESLLNDERVETVVLGGCYGDRGGMAIEALKAGKHVIADKPLCTSLSELDEIERLANEKNLKVSCMYTMRFEKRVVALKKLFDEGVLGEINNVYFGGQHPLNYGKRPMWYFEEGKHGGVINDIAIHGIDILHFALGLELDEILAARCWNKFADRQPQFKDSAQFMIREKNGAGVLSDISYATPTAPGFSLPYYWQFYVWGTKGMASFSVNGKEPCYFTFENSEQQPLIEEEIERDYLTDFIEMVEGRECTLPMEDVFTATRETLTIQKFSDNKGE